MNKASIHARVKPKRLRSFLARRRAWCAQRYRALYRQLPLHRGATRLDAAAQLALLPADASGLVNHIRIIPTAAIRWGGHPPRAELAPGLTFATGDWDQVRKAPIAAYLDAHPSGRCVRQLFVEGRSWARTDEHAELARKVAAGRTPKGLRTPEDIRAMFAGLYAAFDAMRNEGYKTQVELGSPTPDDEIMVCLDRNGEFHKQHGSGHHRLAMARLLGIAAVPVCIRVIHRDWALARHATYGGDVVAAVNAGLLDLSVEPGAYGGNSKRPGNLIMPNGLTRNGSGHP